MDFDSNRYDYQDGVYPFRVWLPHLNIMKQCADLEEAGAYFGSYGGRAILMLGSDLFDRNHKRIFTDDIIELSSEHAKLIGASRVRCLVQVHNGAFMYGRHASDPQSMNTYLWMTAIGRDCVVIGNRWANPGIWEEMMRGEG